MKKLLLLASVALFGINSYAQINCTVKGTVVDRPESQILYLVKPFEDLRVVGRQIEIKDGKFNFTITDPDEQYYTLNFKDETDNGRWRPVPFCTTNGTIEMTLYPKDETDKNTIIGGSENLIMREQNQYIQKLYDSIYKPFYSQMKAIPKDEYFSPYGTQLRHQIDTTQGDAKLALHKLWNKKLSAGEILSPKVLRLKAQCDSAQKIISALLLQDELETLNLYSYSTLIGTLSTFQNERDHPNAKSIEQLEETFNQYAARYPEHTYTKMGRKLISDIHNIKVSGKYVDFSAPDLDGKMHKLSSLIQGKIAIIDLWASWCGPCRASSMSFIPIYNQYKDQGFTIVGVAREKDNDRAMRKAIEQDGYEWINLTEINDRGNIWATYGVGSGGGGVFMVDSNGTILAINPNAAKVREILDAKIK